MNFSPAIVPTLHSNLCNGLSEVVGLQVAEGQSVSVRTDGQTQVSTAQVQLK